jgi:hypothetical protein
MSDASYSSAVHSSTVTPSSWRDLFSSSQVIQEYISTLTPFEEKGLAIAIDHLGPSFDMKLSSGFVRWKETRDAKSK